MMARMAAPSPNQQVLVSLLGQHAPTHPEAQALLLGMGDGLPSDLQGEAMWARWLWGSDDEPLPPEQIVERLHLLRSGISANLGLLERPQTVEQGYAQPPPGGQPTSEPSPQQRRAALALQQVLVATQAVETELAPPRPLDTGAHPVVGPAAGDGFPILQPQGGMLPPLETAAQPKGRLIGFPLLLVVIALGLVGYIVVLLVGGLG